MTDKIEHAGTGEADLLAEESLWAWEQSLPPGPELLSLPQIQTLINWGRIWISKDTFAMEPDRRPAPFAWAQVYEARPSWATATSTVHLQALALSRNAGGLNAGRLFVERLIEHYRGIPIHAEIPRKQSNMTCFYMLMDCGFFEEGQSIQPGYISIRTSL